MTEEDNNAQTQEELIAKVTRVKKNGLNQDGGIYLQKPPNPPMPILIASLFSYMASGARGTIDAISHLANLDGARVDVPRFRRGLEFLKDESGYKTAVSSRSFISSICCVIAGPREHNIGLINGLAYVVLSRVREITTLGESIC